MGDRPSADFTASSLHVHTTMLQQVAGSGSGASESMLIHSYKRSFNGFAARLTKIEMQKMAGMKGVVSVFPSQKLHLHTTKSWDFIGFPQNVKRAATLESNIIIGMFDTGIWPESQSFSDKGFGPPPAKWKGTCQNLSNFTCNNKIIGARYYRSNETLLPGDILSPRDAEGHGSHTSSTAAGALVSEASLLGFGLGTARGGVPTARIAVYKICWVDGCNSVDILAAFDDAIADGVDIISLSVGGSPTDYFQDPIAIGSFHAMKNGILTSTSAGNAGPKPATVSNLAPWLLSVAASTIDRQFVTKVKLGNGETYEVTTLNKYRFCIKDSLDGTKVRGKIVLCDMLTRTEAVVAAGGIGAIMRDARATDVAFESIIPISHLDLSSGSHVADYYNSTGNPSATIFRSIETGNELAPFVVSFSSRGHNNITKDILTPDIAAPGVHILAAWSQGTSITGAEEDNRVLPYNIISGTSMACPHASAVAVYIKTFHPLWSPAAIKSALITTASSMNGKNIDAEFAYGAGHINPLKAVDPGLVYDAGEVDYIKFLCGQGYNTTTLRSITGDSSSCNLATKTTVWDLNYPSFTVSSSSGQFVTRIFHRTVTNVGSDVSTYKAIISAPKGLSVQVSPSVLTFKSLGEKQSFIVTIQANLGTPMISGSLIWDDGVHQVRSPVVAYIPSN
ncbi:cucumisin family protein [Tripterygium wilfordii]|uniref:Cucumisin family protein n=1 Tax=Tripterygium wilfordii TaxID=458696 RepID=A0A7J7C648_TRIWF|nr:cucumisin family protein [Tripterygium wilfordii]